MSPLPRSPRSRSPCSPLFANGQRISWASPLSQCRNPGGRKKRSERSTASDGEAAAAAHSTPVAQRRTSMLTSAAPSTLSPQKQSGRGNDSKCLLKQIESPGAGEEEPATEW
jgi:hypothetical protein